MNDKSSRLVYYLDANKMAGIRDGEFGIRIVARPSAGFSYYCVAEFHSDGISLSNILKANQATYVDVKLHRFVDENVFRFDPASDARVNFKRRRPSGNPINNT